MNKDQLGWEDIRQSDGLVKMLLRSMREYEDLIYFKKYKSDQEREEIEEVIEELR